MSALIGGLLMLYMAIGFWVTGMDPAGGIIAGLLICVLANFIRWP